MVNKDSSDKVQIMLDVNIMFCTNHLEPLRENWPNGVMMAMLGMFNVVVSDPRIVKECGGDTKEISNILTRHKPVCCYVNENRKLVAEEVITLASLGLVWGQEPN